MSEVKTLAAFDFDGTLTRRDSLLPFLLRSLGPWGFFKAFVQSAAPLLAYALRIKSNHRAKARLLQKSFIGRSCAELEQHALAFIQHDLPDLWQPWALEQLRQHQRLGHLCVLVSASPGVYLHAVAKRLNLDAVLCTEMETLEGCYSGNMATQNCHGEEKVRRLRLWMTQTLGESASVTLHAYGDTAGDLPMLRMAQHAWYRGKPWKNP